MVTIFWSCEGSILLNVMQRGMTVNSDTIPACRKMKCFQCVWHDKNLYEILLQHNSTRPHTSVKSQEAITQLDGWSYLIHPTALRFSPLWTPERSCLWKEVWVEWWCGQHHQNFVHQQDKEWYQLGLHAHVPFWCIAVELHGEFVEIRIYIN